jgi:hypothetical protein
MAAALPLLRLRVFAPLCLKKKHFHRRDAEAQRFSFLFFMPLCLRVYHSSFIIKIRL